MKPLLILQNLVNDGPAYLQRWMQARGLAFELRNFELGHGCPEAMQPYSGLAVLGGAMSANDDMPSLRASEGLILQAFALGRPVLGHCLGGQLMARALGATVAGAATPEIGLQGLEVLAHPLAQAWLGPPGRLDLVQWHFEAFSLPVGALPLARSAACAHQAFALGPHLAMQFHIETDAQKLALWASESSSTWDAALARHPATVQSAAQMRALTPQHWAAHHAAADRVYERWLSLLPR